MKQHAIRYQSIHVTLPYTSLKLLHAVPEKQWVNLFPQDYLDMVGLSAMFPRVEVFLIQGSPVDMLERPPMDGKKSS